MATIRRCAHFVPGASEKMLNKALATEALLSRSALLSESLSPAACDGSRFAGDAQAH